MPTETHTFLELKMASLRQKKALVHFPESWAGREWVSWFVLIHKVTQEGSTVPSVSSTGVKLISKDTQVMTQDQVQIMSVDELMSSVRHILVSILESKYHNNTV